MTLTEATRRRLFILGLISPGFIPLIAPYLPFQDWPGHLGVVGVMLHYDDPAAALPQYFEYTAGWHPNAILYWVIYFLAQLLSPLWAAKIVLAVTLGALGPAMLCLCKSAGADERLAYLALPLAIGRHVYCGFIPNAAALVLGILSVALFFEHRRVPTTRKLLGLFGLLVLAHGLHAFVYLAFGGLIGLAALCDWLFDKTRARGLTLAVVTGTLLVMLPHLRGFSSRAPQDGGLVSALLEAIQNSSRTGLLKTFWDWLFASYRYSLVDDVLQLVWMIGLLILVVGTYLRSKTSDKQSEVSEEIRGLGVRQLLGIMILTTIVMFIVLPSYVGPPVNWWGGRLRLPIIVVLLLIPLAGSWWAGHKFIGRALVVLNLGVILLAGADLYRYSTVEMRGFDEIVRAIPPGKRISLLHWTPKSVHEYPGEPHGYASNYYLFEKGGFVPQNVFEHADVPVKRRVRGAAPPWGQADYFDWFQHGRDYDGFIVRVHEEYEHSPLHGKNQERVELVLSRGAWRYYRRRMP